MFFFPKTTLDDVTLSNPVLCNAPIDVASSSNACSNAFCVHRESGFYEF